MKTILELRQETYSKVKTAVQDYYKALGRLEQEEADIKESYSNMIDKGPMHTELQVIEDQRTQAKNSAKYQTAKALKGLKELITQWGTYSAEKIEDLAVLKLDLDEQDVLALAENHKDNGPMLKEIKKYAQAKGYSKTLGELVLHPTADELLEDLQLLDVSMQRGLENPNSYEAQIMQDPVYIDSLF